MCKVQKADTYTQSIETVLNTFPTNPLYIKIIIFIATAEELNFQLTTLSLNSLMVQSSFSFSLIISTAISP